MGGGIICSPSFKRNLVCERACCFLAWYGDFGHEAAIAFASRYVDEEFEEFDEYVSASMEDFLNLHNGLFSVNMSNDYTVELHLQPPEAHENTVLSTEAPSYLLPVIYSFGTVNFIFSVTSE